MAAAPIPEASTDEAVPAIDPIPYRWGFLAMLALSNTLASLDRSIVSVIAEPLKREFHVSDMAIGILGGIAFSATYALAVLPMGYFIDRINRRILLSVAISIWSILTAVCATSGNFATLVLARMGVGAAESPGLSTSLSLIADLFPVNRRNTAISLYAAAGPVGAIISFLAGGQILSHSNWRMVFLIAGVPGLFLAMLFYFFMREPPRSNFERANDEPERLSLFRSIYSVMSDPVLRYAIVAITVSSGVIYSSVVWGTSFLVRVHGLTISHGVVWTGLGFGLGTAFGSILAGPVVDRFSNGNQRRVVVASVITLMIGVVSGGVMALGNTLAISLAGLDMLAVMGGFFVPGGYAIILSLAAPTRRGTTMGTASFIMTLMGTGLMPIITGAISDALGRPDAIRIALLVTTMSLLISALCYLRVCSLLTNRTM